jgi:cytochrome c peroxidase
MRHRPCTAALKAACWLFVAAACAGCGGSGGGIPPGQNVVVPPNSPPVALKPNRIVHQPIQHAINYDVTENGTTFADPDGDALMYSVSLDTTVGLSVQGNRVVGLFTSTGDVGVKVVANDGHGHEAVDRFQIHVSPNTAPALVSPNYALMTTQGAQINYDPTKGGSAFTDAEGDPITYTLAFASPARGLSITGGRIVGALLDVGAVTFELTAADPFGASTTDRFLIALAAPEPGRPTLPASSFVYADEELPRPLPAILEDVFRNPPSTLWDTETPDNPITDAGATLGRVLFYDKRLSLTNTHACATCHQQAHGFASPQRFDVGIEGVPMKRNTMALANVRFNKFRAWFWDMRARNLEVLVLSPIENHTELGNFLTLLEERLAATNFYPPLFEAAFGTPQITSERVSKALTQFLRAIISYRARWDEAYSVYPPDETRLTAQEVRGSRLFNEPTPARCGLCHIKSEQLVEEPRNNGLDATPDPAVFNGQFRAPSLRNIAVSAPYMHDGRFATLREVIDHYDHGVQKSAEVDYTLLMGSPAGPVPLQMNLTEDDKAALEAFLRLLTDNALLTDPRFADPFQ